MKSIRIGAVIASKRKEKRLTQEELAEYLGVSKPAVSKWESGQSYPDITLLPVIASYFGISVDHLLDYQPQLAKEEIRRLYRKLSESFAAGGFEPACAQCRSYVKQYYSCCPLLNSVGLLFVNNASSAPSPEKKSELLHEAIGLFERVEEISEDSTLARQALHFRAAAYLMLGQPSEVIDLLGDIVEIPISTRVLLASAYQQKGDADRAANLLQSSIYLDLTGLLGAVPILSSLYAGNPDKMEQWTQSALKTAEVFGFDRVHPMAVIPVYLNAALLHLNSGNHEKAIEYLEHYAEMACRPGLFPLSLKGGGLFDQIDGLFESLDLGTAPPRSDEAVRQSLKDAVLNLPAWNALAGDERYQRVIRKIKSI